MHARDLLCHGPAPTAGAFWDPGKSFNAVSDTESIILQRLHEVSQSVHDLGARLGPILHGNVGQVQNLGLQLQQMKLEIFARLDSGLLVKKPPQHNVAGQRDSLQTVPIAELRMQKDSLARAQQDQFLYELKHMPRTPPSPWSRSAATPNVSPRLELLIQANTAELQVKSTLGTDLDDSHQVQGHTEVLRMYKPTQSNTRRRQLDGDGNHPPQSRTQSPEPQAFTPRCGAFADRQVPNIVAEELQISPSFEIQTSRTTASGASSSRNRNKAVGMVSTPSSKQMFNIRKELASDVALDEQEYDVAQYYHQEGYAQAIARSEIFGHLTLAVISVNAVYMGIDAEHNTAENLNDALAVFIVSENLFCIFFTFELFVRFSAFKVKHDILKDAWMKFDAILLVIIWWETWIMPLLNEVANLKGNILPTGPLRLFRLLRLARLARLLRSFPELVTLITGMLVASRAVASATVLLIIALYAWGIAMHTFMKDDEELYSYWGTILRCMMTLIANGTLGDGIGDIMRDFGGNWLALCAFISFVVVSALTVLNMLVGVLCEVMGQVALAEKDAVALAKLKSTLLVMLQRIDEEGSGDISKHDLRLLLQDAESVRVTQELNINMTYFIDELHMHYEETESLPISRIMELLIANQGDRATTVADLCSINNFSMWSVRNMIKSVKDSVKSSSHTSKLKVMMHDLAAIKKDIASLTISTCYGNAGHSMQQIDRAPFALPVTPPDGSYSLFPPSPLILGPVGLDLDNGHQGSWPYDI